MNPFDNFPGLIFNEFTQIRDYDNARGNAYFRGVPRKRHVMISCKCLDIYANYSTKMALGSAAVLVSYILSLLTTEI